MALVDRTANNSFVNGQTATRVMTFNYQRSQTTSIVFTMVPNGRRTLPRGGVNFFAFTQSGTRVMSVAYNRSAAQSILIAQLAEIFKTYNRLGSSDIVFSTLGERTLARSRTGITNVNFQSIPFRNIEINQSVITPIVFNSGGYNLNAIFPGNVYFMYPALSPYTSAILKGPICGDKDRIVIQTISRHSRNGNRYAYKRTPSYEILTMDFENILFTDLIALKDFFRLTAGQEVKFIDHYSREWRGIILTDPIEFTSLCKFLNCPSGRVELFSTTLEFEGELV